VNLPSGHELALTLRSLSLRQRGLLFGLGGLLVIGLIGLLWQADRLASAEVATQGGELTEGIIGTPRFINPLLAASDADRDLTALVYSGLLRIGENGAPEPDLAEKYEVSTDGLTYTFSLRDDLSWHDGEPLTTDDVEWTILKAQDPLLKSPRRGAWDGVRVEKVGPREIRFQLKQAYPQFLENATLGILPKHIWSQLDAETFALNQFNVEPIGSGPYRVTAIKKNDLGIAESYELSAFRHFALGRPKIDLLRFRFYRSEEELVAAYRHGEIESLSAVSAEAAAKLAAEGARILRAPLPRVFAVFFNQNRAPALASRDLRQALNLAINRNALIDEVLKGYGTPAGGPLPPLFLNGKATATLANLSAARELLEKAGWDWDEAKKSWTRENKKSTETLALSIATSDLPELRHSAELIKAAWEKLGIPTALKVYEIGDLDLNVIRPRQFETLFFGEILGRTPDLFSFWHSQQRLDPGLNVAQYTNAEVDKLLEKTRTLADAAARQKNYGEIQAMIIADQPAAFVYAPDFLYLLPERVRHAVLPPLNTPSDRLLAIHRWYINTDRVWKIFINQAKPI